MAHTTTFQRLACTPPQSETHWRGLAAHAHRLRNVPGDEAAAKTHEVYITEIRERRQQGSSREIRFCPACELNGKRYILLYMGGRDRCGTCGWDGTPQPLGEDLET